MEGYRRPALPRKVARQLRQEAGFGCARCGHPYVEYHHIIPWAKEQHFRPEDMIAVCSNCHVAISKLGRDTQREFKAKPYNIANGRAKGALEYDKSDLCFKIGGNWYEDTRVILRLCNTPLISCRLEQGQAMISVLMLDETLHQILVIEDNEITFRTDDLWDFEYAHNYVVARSAPRDLALLVDFRGDEATIEGKFQVGNQKVELGPDATTLPGGNMFIGNRMRGVGVAFQLQDENLTLPVRCRI